MIPQTPSLTLNIRVLDIDIQLGRQKDCECCPIAMALHRAMRSRGLFCRPDKGDLRVGTTKISDADGNTVGWLPHEAINFISAFDRESARYLDGRFRKREKAQPFEFLLGLYL